MCCGLLEFIFRSPVLWFTPGEVSALTKTLFCASDWCLEDCIGTLPLCVDPSSSSSGLLNSVLALLASTAGDGEQYDEKIANLPAQGFIIIYVGGIFGLSTPVRDVGTDFVGWFSTAIDIPNRTIAILC